MPVTRFFAIVLTLLAALLAPPASAEVAAASPGGFLLQAESELRASPDQAWRRLVQIQSWWSPAHTYSGDSNNLRLTARAGGCWCERWGDAQSVEHARVVLAMQNEGVRTLRAVGGLGPLQAMGASGVITFTVSPSGQGAKLTMSYRVAGDPSLNFGELAPAVDSVLMEQFARLIRYADTGAP
jgi:hypothetical protein